MECLEVEKYCRVCSNPWTFVRNYLLHAPYYYCSHCDKIYISVFREFKDSEINSKAYQDMKKFARIKKAKEHIEEEDLIKLGKL